MANRFVCNSPEEEIADWRLWFVVCLRMDGDPSALLEAVKALDRIVVENPERSDEWRWPAAPLVFDGGRTVEFRFSSSRHFLTDRIVSDLMALSEVWADYRVLFHATDSNPCLDETNSIFVLVVDGCVSNVESCVGFTFDEALAVFDLGERVAAGAFASAVSAIVKRIDGPWPDFDWRCCSEVDSHLLSVVGGQLAAVLKASWSDLPPIEEGDAVSLALADLDQRLPVVGEILERAQGKAADGLVIMEATCAELVMLASTKKASGVVSAGGGGRLSV